MVRFKKTTTRKKTFKPEVAFFLKWRRFKKVSLTALRIARKGYSNLGHGAHGLAWTSKKLEAKRRAQKLSLAPFSMPVVNPLWNVPSTFKNLHTRWLTSKPTTYKHLISARTVDEAQIYADHLSTIFYMIDARTWCDLSALGARQQALSINAFDAELFAHAALLSEVLLLVDFATFN